MSIPKSLTRRGLIVVVTVLAVLPSLLSGNLAAFPYGNESLFLPKSLTHQVFQFVKWKYVDPDRAQPETLLEGAFKVLESQYPEILIDRDLEAGVVTVKVHDRESRFPLEERIFYDEAARVIEDILAFAAPLVESDVDITMMRYMVLNGSLSALDPHSNVFGEKHYKDFKIRTTGSFGGIGFTFGVHEGDLTIISPIPETPADRAGLKSGDKILYIDGEPTTNMGTDVAVSKMRGTPGTSVTLTIGREEWTKPRDISIIREIIRIVSVDKFLLGWEGQKQVLYVGIKNFQEKTSAELRAAIAEMDGDHVEGIILDLRNNPGGLLQQAIEVSDGFLDQGVIVSTRSRDNQNVRRSAVHSDAKFTTKPVVILINRGSASASEIVAAALQDSRAVVVGQTSFGKGSVQQVYKLMDGGGLLLTVSQYLTPNDISIQSIGIQPDIVVTPIEITEESLRLGPIREHRGEAGLENAFQWGNAVKESVATIEFLREKKDEEAGSRFKEVSRASKRAALEKEFPIRLARMILAESGGARAGEDREALLEISPEVVSALAEIEKRRITEAMADVDVDWSPHTGAQIKASLEVTFPTDTVLQAGSTVEIPIGVRNTGSAPLHRVWGDTDSANPLLKGLDFAFGRIDPGQERVWTASVEVPKSVADRWDTFTLNLKSESFSEASAFTGNIRTRSKPLPKLSYSFSLEDENPEDVTRNNDGLLEEGERAKLLLKIVNSGEVESDAVDVNLHADVKENFYLDNVRHRTEKIQPGESRNVPLSFRLLEAKEDGEVEIKITLSDRENGIFLSDSLILQTGKPYPASQRRYPPRFSVNDQPPVRTGAASVTLKLTVKDDISVKEIYAYSGEKKTHYVRNMDGGPNFPVTLEMPLEPGSNRLVVFARDEMNIVTQRTFYVHRSVDDSVVTEVRAP